MPDGVPSMSPAPADAGGQASGGDGTGSGAGGPGGVDIQKLADKVYRLMLADVRRDRRPDRRPFITRPRED